MGATGAVGQEIINLLENREFPASEVRLLASAKSVGVEMKVFGNIEKVRETTASSFEDLDIDDIYRNYNHLISSFRISF